MNQALSGFVQSLTPPLVWDLYMRARGLGDRHPWRQFRLMMTSANPQPLFGGRFGAIYDKYQSLDPLVSADATRYVDYNVCFFADQCREIPGDFVCAGVSWGVAPRAVFDFVDLPSLGETLHLVDPLDGRTSRRNTKKSEHYNCNAEYVLRQYPPDAPIKLHRLPIPIRLGCPIAFVFTNTGDPEAEAEALPIFYETLSPGGIIITNQYANNPHYFEPVVKSLGIAPLWLPSGQGVFFKR